MHEYKTDDSHDVDFSMQFHLQFEQIPKSNSKSCGMKWKLKFSVIYAWS